MSSVTDQYQPAEKDLLFTQSLLQDLADYREARLVIQTRSPLVTRDSALFRRFRAMQIDMTITTILVGRLF
ncbi:MAG TPA: hypothetical protein VKQ52_15365 [Puia sp.]|nr:hypothetical protein [Puia sp.]